jgi:hypothetical protein
VLAFGLYESFRLLLPGGLAVLVFGLAFRLAAGPSDTRGGVAQTVASADAGQFLVAALASGFLLYLLDVPAQTRLYREADPPRVIMPSDRLKELWANTANKDHSFAGYFLLSDAYLPPESHRRVYFWGSLYRIYAYARLLAAAALGVIAPLAVWLAADEPTGRALPSGTWLFAGLALVAACAVVGAAGELGHAQRATRPKKDQDRAARTREYKRKLAARTRSVAPAAIAVLLSQAAAVAVAAEGSALSLAAGIGLGLAAVGLWGLIEVGPPGDRQPVTVHERVLRGLRVTGDRSTQYPAAQRTLMDLALFLPVAVGVATAAQSTGAPPSYVLLWGLLMIPCTLVMAVRKHEQRLLATYGDQLAWLELNRDAVLSVGRKGFGQTFTGPPAS